MVCVHELREQARRSKEGRAHELGVNIQPSPNNLWLWGSQTLPPRTKPEGPEGDSLEASEAYGLVDFGLLLVPKPTQLEI